MVVINYADQEKNFTFKVDGSKVKSWQGYRTSDEAVSYTHLAGLSSKPDVPRLPVKITSISSLKIAKTWLITRLISRSMVGIRIAI